MGFAAKKATIDLLITCLFVVFALMLWMIGKENFPSVKSSANPLLVVYTED